MNIAQAGVQGDCAVVEGPHGKRPGERLDRRKPRVAWRKLHAKDHPLGVLPYEIGGDLLGVEVENFREDFEGKTSRQTVHAFVNLGAVETLRDAVYFSTITYGAIGYSDEKMAEQWHLVSAIEGINGIVLIGWSTAFFVTVIGRMRGFK